MKYCLGDKHIIKEIKIDNNRKIYSSEEYDITIIEIIEEDEIKDYMELDDKLFEEESNEFNYKIFMYGAQQDVVEKAKEKLEEQYQNINICGYLNGFEKEEKVILDSINNSNPDILFVALGSPRQEKFISKYFIFFVAVAPSNWFLFM